MMRLMKLSIAAILGNIAPMEGMSEGNVFRGPYHPSQRINGAYVY
jgi:hypothetical protein